MNQPAQMMIAKRQLTYEIVSGGTGLVLALFMWGHVVLVGSILTGARGFDWMATMLEDYFIAQPTVFGIFTLFLVPTLFSLMVELKAWLGRLLHVPSWEAHAIGEATADAYLTSKVKVALFNVKLEGFDPTTIEAAKKLSAESGAELWMACRTHRDEPGRSVGHRVREELQALAHPVDGGPGPGPAVGRVEAHELAALCTEGHEAIVEGGDPPQGHAIEYLVVSDAGPGGSVS